jgi:hypothetical protein
MATVNMIIVMKKGELLSSLHIQTNMQSSHFYILHHSPYQTFNYGWVECYSTILFAAQLFPDFAD